METGVARPRFHRGLMLTPDEALQEFERAKVFVADHAADLGDANAMPTSVMVLHRDRPHVLPSGLHLFARAPDLEPGDTAKAWELAFEGIGREAWEVGVCAVAAVLITRTLIEPADGGPYFPSYAAAAVELTGADGRLLLAAHSPLRKRKSGRYRLSHRWRNDPEGVERQGDLWPFWSAYWDCDFRLEAN